MKRLSTTLGCLLSLALCCASMADEPDDSRLAPVIRLPIASEAAPHLPPVIAAEEYSPPVGRATVSEHARAGWPLQVAPWARLTYDANYRGYFVGGGAAPGIHRHSRPLRRDEGTFGVDYSPWFMRVGLLHSNGHLFQGGRGQYEPDHKNWPFGLTFTR